MFVGAGVFLVLEDPELTHYGRSDMFILAVGVYADETHSCLKHADGCDAEFKDVAVNYTIVSGDGGVPPPRLRDDGGERVLRSLPS